MWRRVISSQLKTLKALSSSSSSASASLRSISKADRFAVSSHLSHSPVVSHFSCQYGSVSAEVALKKAEDVIPIVTGHEREELQAELEGREILDINYPVGAFGTKEAPAVIKSYYDERIVGCPGGEDEDEHDVVWFRLQKDKPHECPVCTQYFALEVVGPGGSPDGYGDDDHHH